MIAPTTVYRHPDWKGTDRRPVPLLQRHSIGVLAREIVTANTNNQYTGILLIGKSGSGKSTLTQTLVHRLHQKRNYVVRWFSKADIRHFVAIIKKLPPVPHILVFEDASYALRGMSDAQIEEIAAELTYIRHKLKRPVIVVLQIHYSKAIEKFFRDTDITIFTSITDNERTNYLQLLGTHNSQKINKFIRIYHNALFKGHYDFTWSTYTGEKYVYHTNNPFRPSLVSSVGSCHFLLYAKESCGQCSLDGQFHGYPKLEPQVALDKLVQATNRTTTRSIIRQYCFFAKGIKCLPINTAAAWNVINEIARLYDIDWEEVLNLAEKQLKVPRKKGYRFRKRVSLVKEELQRKAKEKNPYKA